MSSVWRRPSSECFVHVVQQMTLLLPEFHFQIHKPVDDTDLYTQVKEGAMPEESFTILLKISSCQ